jgi:protoporphyrinogen oxidase
MTAALRLHRAGLDTRVVEKAPFVGGLTRTVERQGFRFDLGGHRFYTKNAEVLGFVADLLGDELLEVPRLSRIHFRGRYVDYPIRPLDALRNVGPGTALRILRDVAMLSFRRGRRAASLEQWMLDHYGKTLYETFFKVYAQKVWGLPGDRIDAGLAAQRVKGLDLRDTLLNALFPRRKLARESLVERFWYPRLGYGRICERMREQMPPGSIALETAPVRIAWERARVVRVDLADSAGRAFSVRPEHLVSSIPVTSLLALLDPPPPPEVRRAAQALGFRGVVFVALFLARPRVREESWIYFPSPEVSFARTTEPRNWSTALCPPGTTSIVAEHFCDEGDAVFRARDEDLVGLTVTDLADRLGLFARSEVIGSCVVRAPRAYPRMDVGHGEPLRVIEAWLDTIENLHPIGRAGLYRYHNTDHVIETAFAAAETILGRRRDVRAVNSELAYHEARTPR